MRISKFMALLLSGTMILQSFGPLSFRTVEAAENKTLENVLGNPVVWFDASKLNAEDGDKISTWENLAGENYDGKQNEQTKQPTYIAKSALNQKPAVKFEGSTFFELEGSKDLDWDEMSIFAVIRPEEIANNNDNNQIFSKLGFGGGWDHNWYFNINGASKFNFGWKDGDGYHDFGGRTDIYAQHNYLVSGVKSQKTGTLYINGKKIGDMVSNAQGIECVDNDQSVFIGGNPLCAQSMKGEICEIVAYDKGLSPDKVHEVQNYLSDKWGIDVDISDQIKESGEMHIKVDDTEIREFSFHHEKYKRYVKKGTTKIPTVSAKLVYDGVSIDTVVEQAETLPGTAVIKVPAYGMEYKVEFLEMEKDVVSLKSPELNQVKITDGFWKNRMEQMEQTSVEYVLDELEKQGSIRNYQNVINGVKQTNNYPWIDGLLMETIRAGADFMKNKPNAELKKKIDAYIDVIYNASMTSENGYLSTHAMMEKPGQYFDATGNPRWYHDAYNFGCLVEAGVHYYDATGDPKLLYVAARFAEFMVENYGYGTKENGEKKTNMVPSHELPEEALLDMYLLLKDNTELVQTLNRFSEKYTLNIRPEAYGDLVKFWIENRGNYDNRVNGMNLTEYAQDHAYYFDQEQAAGHAVRANLYYTGIAAAGLAFDDNTYLASVDKIWHHIVEKQMYVTGGVGATGVDEAYGDDYYLPNDGYCETCAQVAMGFCSEYLLNAYGQSEYGDVVENYLYNGVLGGIGEDGKTFYYTQPLNSMNHMRWDWDGCPCCPPMLLKFYSNLGKYIYSYNDTDTYVNQFVSSDAELGNGVRVSLVTDMPWEGNAAFTVSGKNTKLHIRIPEWQNKEVTFKINGTKAAYEVEDGFAVLNVAAGDTVSMSMEIEARRVYADEKVKDDEGKVALAYGPVVYCVESTDNGLVEGINLNDDTFAVDKSSALTTSYDATLLGGIVKINTVFEVEDGKQTKGTAIPFYARANRGNSSAYVWLNEEIPKDVIRAKKWLAKATSTSDVGNSAAAAFDGNRDTYWAAGSNSFPQYLVVDLEDAYTVDTVRTYFTSAQAWKYNVLYSIDGKEWKEFANQSNNQTSTEEYTDRNEVEARYIAIEFTESGVGYVMIPEVEVYAKGSDENIAMNKMCGASSSGNTGASAFSMIDGSLYTRYCPNGEKKPQTVTMDMGGVTDLSQINIVFEKETDWTYNVEISEDGENWTTYVTDTFRGDRKTIEKEATGRYLRFNVTGTTGGVWASAWEMDVKIKTPVKDVFALLRDSRNPQQPEEPEQPADPQQPEEPEQPADPQQPTTPEQSANPQQPEVKNGDIVTVGKLTYKITSVNKGTASFEGSTKKNLKKVTIPATVSYKGKIYKITKISKNVFKNSKSLTSLVIGVNVEIIESGSFYGCKKLKNIKIAGKSLKKVGKNAYKGIYKKVVVKANKVKLKAYKKLLQKAGIGKKAVFKKI
ncbi:MAG: glycoside hydrolase family 127 protein [Lachnospiraceae bacterium]|nr:glycoside hydrolase family 127 protein [Lachnospiraceae bacterium]